MINHIIKMEIGEQVVWVDPNGFNRICTVLSVNRGDTEITYDILLPERNVLFASIYRSMENTEPISKGETVVYKHRREVHEAKVSKVDWSSNSVQIQIIRRNIV